HIAYGSIRMEPVFLVLGQSAATAAALAIDGKLDVQKVDYAKLREKLLADKQVLEFAAPPSKEGGDIKGLVGVALDDEDAVRKGFESVSTSIGPYFGAGYRHDGGKGDGKQSATYTPDIPIAGKYDVRVSYTANANRATNATVTVKHAGGTDTKTVNQRKAPPISELFASVGTFRFEKGKGGSVTISNEKADGYVIIDAVQFVPVK
ncbi:MAG TPA: FAD-dependent oxidoreductase, partial [Gemmataceae bacterium]|nr:FAD-dependent oxidoreductase [Gemmataceae bacterium]